MWYGALDSLNLFTVQFDPKSKTNAYHAIYHKANAAISKHAFCMMDVSAALGGSSLGGVYALN